MLLHNVDMMHLNMTKRNTQHVAGLCTDKYEHASSYLMFCILTRTWMDFVLIYSAILVAILDFEESDHGARRSSSGILASQAFL